MSGKRVLIAACMAAMVLLATAVQSVAGPPPERRVDPHCLSAYNNQPGIFEFAVDTPTSHISRAGSNVIGSGYLCGQYLDPGPGNGEQTFVNHADMAIPPGVEIADTGSVATDSWAGEAVVNVLRRRVSDSLPAFTAGAQSRMLVNDKALCAYQRDHEVGGQTPQDTIVSCLRGRNAFGENWNWATRDANGRLTLTVGPMWTPAYYLPFTTDPDPSRSRASITYGNIDLCAQIGAPIDENGEGECGTSGNFQQMNGDASDCSDSQDPNGRYSATATMASGTVAGPVAACVNWTRGSTTDPACTNHPDLSVHDFTFQTPDSTFAYDTSGVRTAITACDSQIRAAPTYEQAGSQSQFTRFDVGMPPGVEFNPSPIAPAGSYVGRATVNALSWLGDPQEPAFFPDLAMDMRVASPSLCPPDSLVCLSGATRPAGPLAAHGTAWVKRQAGGPPTLTFGELQNDTYPSSPAGVTKLGDLSPCAFAGATSGTTCGARGPAYLFRNGLPGSTYYDYANCQTTGSCPIDPVGGCAGGRYHYTATATTRDGRTTAPAYSCYGWDCNPAWRDTGCRPPAPRGAGRGKPTKPKGSLRIP